MDTVSDNVSDKFSDSVSEKFTTTKDLEPIPGYRLVERIGVGGYGEVWKATAPGGLEKAVKIIHGHVEDTRAIRELTSLNRAKGLCHPFILSLERIEVSDGHLVIVTELADATLMDRYQHYRRQGLSGIPREELLQYMREAAEALDYLYDHYSLQHLDVKAENLLMFGSHVKVADFGMMKDLQESCVSLVSGLTPRYASPEMFEGKPGRYSDQYSLAVLYQEMVSGQLPFVGASIAALASQHLNCAPDLSSLSPLDRFAVGKALSKEPQRRFSDCRQFVERLMHRSSAMIMFGNESDNPRAATAAPDAQSDTTMPASDDTSSESPPPLHDGQTIQLAAPEVTQLPRLQIDDKQPVYRPTLFVGVGGTGGRILARLRQLVADRLGTTGALPALQFVYIDTDMDAIDEIAAGPWSEGLREDEIVVAPLRQTQDYRSSIVSRLESLSRRWIYNVPRSLRTQGLRALGRMAFLDHSRRIIERLRAAVLACTEFESLPAAVAPTGIEFQPSDPRVFIVSSISGGTGGGMTIDLGYAARQVLAECGYVDDDVCGVLVHPNSAGSQTCSFGAANAYAFLDELRYFAQPGCDFPGERACGLAGFREHGPTFRSTYLFDFGDNHSATEYSEGLDRTSEYLYLSSVTPAAVLFDECRRLERENPTSETLRVRTAGICPFGVATREDPGDYAELLCKFLVRKWKVGIDSATNDEQVQLSDFERLYQACDPQDSEDGHIRQLVTQQLQRHPFDCAALSREIHQLIQEQLQTAPAEYLRSVIDDSLEEDQKSKTESPVALAARRLQSIIGQHKGLSRNSSTTLVSLRSRAIPGAEALGQRIGERLRDWILELVDTDTARVDGARKAVSCLRGEITQVQQQAAEQLELAEARLTQAWHSVAELQNSPLPKRRSGRKTVIAVLQNHAECLLNELVCDAVCRTLSVMDPMVIAASDHLRELWKDLTQFADQFRGAPPELFKDHDESHEDSCRLASLFRRETLRLIQELDRAVESQCFRDHEPLREVLTKGSQLRETLATRMRALARQVVLQACRNDSLAYLQRAIQGHGDVKFERLVETCFRQATPLLLSLGGSKRLIVSAPEQIDQEQLGHQIEALAGEDANLAFQPNGDLYLCYEVGDVPLEGIQTRLIRQRHDCQELAARLHTRINLDWTLF